MKADASTRSRWMRLLGVFALASFAAGSPALQGHARAAPVLRAAPDLQAATEAQAREVWRESLSRTALPAGGCFKAAYPSATWVQVPCTAAPATPYLPRHGRHGYTVGDGNDDVAVAPGLISSAVGSFPSVTGVKSERGAKNRANAYSLQLNSNFFTTTVCNGAANPSSCQGWQQFVYSNSGLAFMQYWLISYGPTCPAGGWMPFSNDCYRNSAAVSVPTQVIAQLANLKVTGTAVANGTDTFMFTTATNAYSTTGNDSVVRLAAGWGASEYNIVGDGNGSAAKFNIGSSLNVQIALKDGSTSAPTCKGGAGTTAETNNLNLGSCTTAGGASPSITFAEAR